MKNKVDQPIFFRVNPKARIALKKKAKSYGLKSIPMYFKNLAYRDGVREVFPEIIQKAPMLP